MKRTLPLLAAAALVLPLAACNEPARDDAQAHY